ncbi:pyridoxamine 5'-phosphate oxidase family protein [Nocardia sp. NPDC049149]|uniref:pyridoxamine 5'-phosphate oxidase family protein n=1 Tax=Nocardia sp. NPDC049149 TaxID=3364315 RepID=UPI00371B22D4
MTAPEILTSHPLSDAECLLLLAKVRFGRIVYARHALPTIRPVNHLIEDEMIVVASGSGIGIPPYQQVVTYEADTLHPDTQLGWFIIVTGTAEPITDPSDLSRYQAMLRPRLPGSQDRILRIHPEIITGIQYREATAPEPPQ